MKHREQYGKARMVKGAEKLLELAQAVPDEYEFISGDIYLGTSDPSARVSLHISGTGAVEHMARKLGLTVETDDESHEPYREYRIKGDGYKIIQLVDKPEGSEDVPV